MRPRPAALLILTLAACQGGAGPWTGVPEIAPSDLESWMATGAPPTVLDLRDAEAYRAGHLPGALSVPSDAWIAYVERSQFAPGQRLLMVCAHGHESLAAAARARGRGADAVSLSGGMGGLPPAYPLQSGEPPALAPEATEPMVLQVGFWEQLLIAVTGLGVKSTYMAISLVLIVILWRSRERGLVLMRQSQILFLGGEGACAISFAVASGDSMSWELLHGLGMVGMGALLPWALFTLLDERVLRYSDPTAGCAFQRFCGGCWKRDPVPCGLHRLFLFAAPALAVASLMPVTAPIEPERMIIPVFDSQIVWVLPYGQQVVQWRIYPLLASALFVGSFLLLLPGRRFFRVAEGLFFTGFGFASFAMLRFVFFHAYRHFPGWGDAWEELTEFLAIVFVTVFLWLFRKQLGVLGFVDRLFTRKGASATGGPSPEIREAA